MRVSTTLFWKPEIQLLNQKVSWNLLLFIHTPTTNLHFHQYIQKTRNFHTFLTNLTNIPSNFKLLKISTKYIKYWCQNKDIVIIFSIVQNYIKIRSIILELFNVISNEKWSRKGDESPFFCWENEIDLQNGDWLECIQSPFLYAIRRYRVGWKRLDFASMPIMFIKIFIFSRLTLPQSSLYFFRKKYITRILRLYYGALIFYIISFQIMTLSLTLYFLTFLLAL